MVTISKRTKNNNKNSRQRNCQNKHMARKKNDNDFGAHTYWNRPTGVRPAGTRYVSKYGALLTKAGKSKSKLTPPGGTRIRLPSPTLSQQSRVPSIQLAPGFSHTPSTSHFHQPPPIQSPHSPQHTSKVISKAEEDDAQGEKAMQKVMKGKLPEFSDEKDWEAAIFELQLVLDRVWHIKTVWISWII